MDEYFKKEHVIEIMKQVREYFENDMRSETDFLKRVYILGCINITDSLEKELINFPAEDAAQVVRCCKCIHRDDKGENIVFCKNFNRDMMPDDFCSVGESEVNNG